MATANAHSKTTKNRRVVWIVAGVFAAVVGLAAALIALTVMTNDPEPSAPSVETLFQEACYDDILDQLRDPDSAHLESERGVLYSERISKYSILGEGRARNGFGGMNRFTFACTGTVAENGYVDLESEITK